VADAPDHELDQRREYWSATEVGRRALRAEMARMEVALDVGRVRLGDAGTGGSR
jgi:hypothetical protein